MLLFGTQIGWRYGFEGVVEKFNDFMRCRPMDYASFTIFSASGVRTAISESLEGELIKEYPVSFSIDTAFERLDSAFYPIDNS